MLPLQNQSKKNISLSVKFNLSVLLCHKNIPSASLLEIWISVYQDILNGNIWEWWSKGIIYTFSGFSVIYPSHFSSKKILVPLLTFGHDGDEQLKQLHQN